MLASQKGILVTGANGFLGSAVVSRLLVHGARDIRCFDRNATPCPGFEDFVSRFPGARVELASGDLRSRAEAKKALEGIDVVYHLAAGMTGSADDILSNTVVASKSLLDEMKSGSSTRVVLVSSFGVYGLGSLEEGATVDENTPLEIHPERRDVYSQAKLEQELLFRECRRKSGLALTVLRPGVVYGPRGRAISDRVGITIAGLFFHMGGSNLLPLTHVDNCAEAIVIAGASGTGEGDAYNVVDDDVPTAAEFLRRYRESVEKIRYVTVPYALTRFVSLLVEKCSTFSGGRVSPVLTTHKSASLWASRSFDNGKLKQLGWKQVHTTQDALSEFFAYLCRTRQLQ